MKMLKALALPAAAALLLASPPALALKLLTEENPPLNYTENKKLTGMATDVVQEMLKRAKIKPDIEVMAWDKAYEKAQADSKIVINGKDKSKYGWMIRVMAAAHASGIEEVGVASKRL